jgi:hypothetical protein
LPEDTSIQQLPKIQFSEEWIKGNATAELVESAYNCLPQSEKEKFLATILANKNSISSKTNSTSYFHSEPSSA